MGASGTPWSVRRKGLSLSSRPLFVFAFIGLLIGLCVVAVRADSTGDEKRVLVPDFIAVLRDSTASDEERVLACDAVIDLDAAKSLDTTLMLHLLDDKVPEVRARAARLLAMSERDVPEVKEALWLRLSDESREVRHSAGDAIKTLRPPSDARSAQSIVEREDRVYALMNAGGKPNLAGIPVRPGNPPQAEKPERPARPALERVVSKDAAERLGALYELSRSDDAVFVKRLLGHIAASDSDAAVRHEAMKLLTGHETQEREAHEALAGAPVTRMAERAYRSLIDSEVFRRVVFSVMDHLMADEDLEIRRSATAWVARENPRGPTTPTRFSELLMVGDFGDRRAAAEALRVRHDPAELIVGDLVLALHDDDAQVVGTAIELLGTYGEAADPAVDTLIQISANRTNAQRAEAAFTLLRLGLRGREAGLKYWIKAMAAGDVQEQEQAVHALATIGADAQPAVPGLVALLGGGSNQLRIGVAQTLAGIGPDAKAAIPALTRMADNHHIDVRSAAVGALAKIDPEGQSLGPALVAAVLNKDRAACGVLAGPMKKAKTPQDVVRRLEDIAQGDPDDGVRETARAAAAELGAHAAPPENAIKGKEG
jgi:HEAT repeat protein